MSGHNYIYSQKYLKYKNKYLDFQNNLNDQSGGNSKTAKNSFFNKIFNNKDEIYYLFKSDIYLDDKLTKKDIYLPFLLEKNFESFKSNPVFNQLFDIIVDGINDNMIDEYVKMYLNGKLGEPNSIENASRFKDAQHLLKKLKDKKQVLKLEIPATFDSLTSLEDFNYKAIINYYKKIIEEEDTESINAEVILDTPKFTIYHPKTVIGAVYYGRNTKWYIAKLYNNMFSNYNEKGQFYIIIPKSEPENKFQLQFETSQLLDVNNKLVSTEFVSKILNDENFESWFNQKIEVDKELLTGDVDFNRWLPFLKESDYDKIIKLTIRNYVHPNKQKIAYYLDKMPNLQELDLDNGYFCQPIGRLLFGLINLEKLTFGSLFDKPIYDSLSKQTKLKELTFGTHFDQPLDGLSFIYLKNLEKLTFGRNFNQNIDENILHEQTKLKELTFGERFNNGEQPLGSSLYNLTKLEKLNFGIYFNQPLNDSLYNLTNLKELYLGSISYSKFNNGGQPLSNSLKSLGKLEKLYFGEEFDQPLGESLYNLTNLKELYLGKGIDSKFNNGGQPLGNSLKSLGKLEILFFGGKFNNGGQPLRDSLYNLTKLKKLSFDFEFDQPLGCSLYYLTNLKELYFAFGKFNNGGQPLDKSFDTLQNLEYLSFGFRFKQKLDEVLNKLPNLQKLWIRNDDYPYSLKSKNPNLKIL